MDTHPLQMLAARAIDRAVGRSFKFVPAGDEALAFDVRGEFSPHPVIRFPDGTQMISDEPAAWVSAHQIAGKLIDDDGAPRDPAGGGMAPDFIRLPGEAGARRVMQADLEQNGYWRLKLTDPV